MINMRVLGLTVSALALLASPGFADQASKGFYVSGGAGLTVPMDNEVESAGLPNHKLSFDPGWLIDGSVGYAYGNGLRTELEVGYRQANADTISNPLSNAALGTTGDYGVLNTMVNVIYDMNINSALTPYVGVGVGYAHVWANDLGIANSATTLLSASDKSAGAFAYQAIAGFSYDLCPQWAATVDYRYLATTRLDFGNMKSEYSSHNVLFGLRYAFNGPVEVAPTPVATPAPVVAPAAKAPAVANTYMVFFDFNKSNLTAEAKSILAAVAAEYKKGKSVRVNVAGHADRSGSDKYNVKLSSARAATVKAELARLGVSAKGIATKAEGESQPLVPTADGVREAQNRRAEIVLGK